MIKSFCAGMIREGISAYEAAQLFRDQVESVVSFLRNPAEQIRRMAYLSAAHHQFDVPRIPDVIRWACREQHNVAQLAGRD